MEYIGFTLLTASAVDPRRAVLAAAAATVIGGIIFIKRNKRIIQERLNRNHG